MFWGSVACQRVACQRASCVDLLLRWQSLTARQQTPSSPWSLTTLRNVSASPCVKSEAPTTTTTTKDKEAEKPLKQWDFAVDPFSVVRAHLGCNIAVSPLDPHVFPQADRAFITVHGDDQGVLLDFQVQYDEHNKELSVLAERASSDLSVLLTAPTKSNLYITTKGKGDVHVQKMECADVCKLQTEKGNCVLHSVKGHHIEVLSDGGNVTGMGTIYGNVDIFTSGNGAVDVKKLQGTIMNVSTEHGPLKVKAVYAESTSVTSSTGRVELGHVHGNATVKNISGDVIVDGSNHGYLKVSSKSGDIDIYVGDSGSADLHSQEGTVCIRVPSSIRARVELSGASVDISPEVILQSTEHNTTDSQTTVTGHVNSKPQVDQWIKAQADQGPIKLKTQSWFESLKLGS